MREIAGVVIVTALVIGGNLLAVQQFGDRETFVPAPEVVADAYLREVAAKRWDLARRFFAEPHAVSDADLHALQRRIGRISHLRTRTILRTDERAVIHVDVRKAGGSEEVTLVLVFEDEWKIGV